ncbi:MAG: type II toxin-antitoxin system RelE/ParE family toxin [Desulfuromonas sp.]|nr:type II toxin-antitoxin system RelE/ParE family toxin [Desulfuromonas sp.]
MRRLHLSLVFVSNVIARIYRLRGYALTIRIQVILLHGFIKKTKTTPDSDLKLAKRRKKAIV